MKPLNHEEIERAFRKATTGYAAASQRWSERAAMGLADAEPEAALKMEPGVYGGCTAADDVKIAFAQ